MSGCSRLYISLWGSLGRLWKVHRQTFNHKRTTKHQPSFISCAADAETNVNPLRHEARFRIAVLPIFLYLYSVGDLALCLVVFAVCAFTDFFDGYLARKLKVTTRFGAYYDAATDFVLVTGIFSFFFLKGLYSVWLLASDSGVVCAVSSVKRLVQEAIMIQWASIRAAPCTSE